MLFRSVGYRRISGPATGEVSIFVTLLIQLETPRPGFVASVQIVMLAFKL
jgi:hypothetical protein